MIAKRTELEICLCGRCASAFYASPEYSITRSDPIQVIQDCCCYCCIRYRFVSKSRNVFRSRYAAGLTSIRPDSFFCTGGSATGVIDYIVLSITDRT